MWWKIRFGGEKKQRVSLTWWECRWRIWLKLIFIATLLPSILIQYIHIFLLTIIVFESSSEINLHRQRCSFTYVINVNREREKKAEWESSEGSFFVILERKMLMMASFLGDLEINWYRWIIWELLLSSRVNVCAYFSWNAREEKCEKLCLENNKYCRRKCQWLIMRCRLQNFSNLFCSKNSSKKEKSHGIFPIKNFRTLHKALFEYLPIAMKTT